MLGGWSPAGVKYKAAYAANKWVPLRSKTDNLYYLYPSPPAKCSIMCLVKCNKWAWRPAMRRDVALPALKLRGERDIKVEIKAGLLGKTGKYQRRQKWGKNTSVEIPKNKELNADPGVRCKVGESFSEMCRRCCFVQFPNQNGSTFPLATRIFCERKTGFLS